MGVRRMSRATRTLYTLFSSCHSPKSSVVSNPRDHAALVRQGQLEEGSESCRYSKKQGQSAAGLCGLTKITRQKLQPCQIELSFEANVGAARGLNQLLPQCRSVFPARPHVPKPPKEPREPASGVRQPWPRCAKHARTRSGAIWQARAMQCWI